MQSKDSIKIDTAVVLHNIIDDQIRQSLFQLNDALLARPRVFKFILTQFVAMHQSKKTSIQDCNAMRELFEQVNNDYLCFHVFQPALENFLSQEQRKISKSQNFILNALQSGIQVLGLPENEELQHLLELDQIEQKSRSDLNQQQKNVKQSPSQKDLHLSMTRKTQIKFQPESPIRVIQGVQLQLKNQITQTDNKDAFDLLYIHKIFNKKKKAPDFSTVYSQVLQESKIQQRPDQRRYNQKKQKQPLLDTTSIISMPAVSQDTSKISTISIPTIHKVVEYDQNNQLEARILDDTEELTLQAGMIQFNILKSLYQKRHHIVLQVTLQAVSELRMVDNRFKQFTLRLETLKRSMWSKGQQLKNVKQALTLKMFKLRAESEEFIPQQSQIMKFELDQQSCKLQVVKYKLTIRKQHIQLLKAEMNVRFQFMQKYGQRQQALVAHSVDQTQEDGFKLLE